MTAVATPPTFSNINRPAWGGQAHNAMSAEDVRGMLLPQRKNIPRTNSASSISSTSSASSSSTVGMSNAQANGIVSPAGDLSGWTNGVPRKRIPPKSQWQAGKADAPNEFVRMSGGRPPVSAGVNGASALHAPAPILPSQGPSLPQRPGLDPSTATQPVLCLLSLNGTFEQKKISVPFYPETLRIGRQTNQKTVPTATNGFFDSKVLSRQHAEIWADRNGKIWIRDVKSSNGTFVNNHRLSPENRESDPHELQSQDNLELGIDIVSEDQKSIVHHKVAAKVEHAGFMSTASSLLDMNFPDLDPSSGPLMMPMSGLPPRGRAGSQSSIASSGRMVQNAGLVNGQAGGFGPHRQFWLAPITTEHIIKKLQTEMRNARQQSLDLARTGQFVNALLSKEDMKPNDKPEVPEPPKQPLVNGNGSSFRADAKAAVFSDPPNPPPSQPLPEKPDAPSLKRGTTERPRSHPPNSTSSPIQQDHLSKIMSLQEQLNTATREIERQGARMRELEEKLQHERDAREQAELAARSLEDAMASKSNGAVLNSEADAVLEEAFDPPAEILIGNQAEPGHARDANPSAPTQNGHLDPSSALLQARLDNVLGEMGHLRQQLSEWKQRVEEAEIERDADRKTLAEMVQQIRRRDEEDRCAAEAKAERHVSEDLTKINSRKPSSENDLTKTLQNGPPAIEPRPVSDPPEEILEPPTLSRQNTITPATGALSKMPRDPLVAQGLPYASMIGVVLIGMGLMAYINGWQPQPRIDR